MALRLGAGPARAVPTRRSVRRIFPAARVAGKNDSDSFRRWRRKPGRGNPFLDFSPRDGGRESPVGCLLLLEAPAIRLAAGRHCRRKSRCGGRTGVPGPLPASIRTTSDPARRKAALPAWDFLRILAILGRILSLRSGKIVLLTPSRRHSGGESPAAGRHPQTSQILGHFPGGVRRGHAIFPAAPEIGDKLWNRLPRRNRPSSSSRAS